MQRNRDSYKFGPYTLAPVSRELWRQGERVRLTDREFDTLHAIVKKLGEPVSAETLLEEVWQGLQVERNNLSQQIASLRKKLGPDANGQPAIKAIVGRGYYVADVVYRSEPEQPPWLRRLLDWLRRAWRIAAIAAAITCVGLVFWQKPGNEIRVVGFRQLTRDGRWKDGPLATDGQRVWFNVRIEGRSAIGWAPVTGGDVTLLEGPFVSQAFLDISPDRKSLLLRESDGVKLYTWQPSGGALRPVPLRLENRSSYAVWHPSGDRIWLSDVGELTEVNAANGTEPMRLRIPGILGKASWDVLGHRLRVAAYDAKADKTTWWELTAGRPPAHMLHSFSGDANESNGAWTADGRLFVYQTGVNDRGALWVTDGGEGAKVRATKITNGALGWNHPAPATDSKIVFALGVQSRGEVTPLPMEAGAKALLGGVPAYELDYSRDGQWVVYSRFPEQTIWRCRPDGSEGRQLSFLGIEAHQPHWSPDGTRIAFMGKKPDSNARWRVYVVPAPGGAIDEPLPRGDDQGVPTWSADGQALVFGDRSVPAGFDRASIHRLDLRTQELTEVPGSRGLWTPRMSPDGKHLAALSHDSKSLFVRDNVTGRWERWVSMEFVEEPVWSAHSDWIQFEGRRRAGGRRLYRIRAEGGEVTETANIDTFVSVGETWFGITPEGRPIGFRGIVSREIFAVDWEWK